MLGRTTGIDLLGIDASLIEVEADLGEYVVQKGMDGIFHYLAKEEAAIRQDPVKRTTDILKRVFGN